MCLHFCVVSNVLLVMKNVLRKNSLDRAYWTGGSLTRRPQGPSVVSYSQTNVVKKYVITTFVDSNGSAVDPLEVLSDPRLSYQKVFYLLNDQARRSMLLRVSTDPATDQNYLRDQLNSFCSSFGDVLYCSAVEDSVS